MAQLKFEEIFRRLNEQLKNFKKTLESLDNDITGQGLKKVESAMKGIATAQKEQLDAQKNLNIARNKGTDLNKKAISDANKISAKQKERIQFQKQAARATEKEIKLNIRRNKSLDIEEQTRLEVFKAQKKQISLQAKENAAKKLGIKRTKGLTQSFKNFAKSILATTVAFLGFRKIFQLGKEAAKMAAEAEGVVAAFKKLNDPNLLKDLREATRGTVNDLELMKAAVKAKNFKIPLENLGTFFEFATKRAAQTGESVDFLVESIINGIGRKSALVLDNLGISASELQQEMKKTGDFAAAAGNIINKELSNMGDIATTSAQKISKIQATFQNISTSVGKFLLPALGKFANFIEKITATKFSDELEDQRVEVNRLALSLTNSNTPMEERRKILEKLKEISPDILGGLEAETLTYDELTTNVRLYNEAIIKKIALASLDEEKQEELNDAADRTIKRVKKEAEVLDRIFEVNAKIALGEGTLEEKVAAVNKELKEKQSLDLRLLKQTKDAIFARDKINTAMELYKIALDKENEALSDVDSFQTRIDAMKKLLGLEDDLKETTLDSVSVTAKRDKTEEELLEARKRRAAEYKRLLAFYKKFGQESDVEGIENIAFGGGVGETRFDLIGDTDEVSKGFIQQSNEIFNTIAPAWKRNLRKFASKVFGSDEGTLLGRLFGGGKDGEKLAEGVIRVYSEAMNFISTLTQNEIQEIQSLLELQDEAIAKTMDLLETEENRIKKLDEAGQGFSTKEKERLEQKLRNEQSARERTLKEEIALKKKQQRLALFQANIDIASAILSIWAGKGGFYVKLAQTLAFGVAGAFQLATIKNQKFATGTDSVPLNGAKPGIDTVHAQLTAGEGVIQEPINKKIPYHKGFKRSMMPAAAEMYLNGMRGNSVYVNDNEIGNGYLKGIEKNTRNDFIYDSMGKLKIKKVGKNNFYYN